MVMSAPGNPRVYVSTPLARPSAIMAVRLASFWSHEVGVPSVIRTASHVSPIGDAAWYVRHVLIMPRSAHSVGVVALIPGRCAPRLSMIDCALPGRSAIATTGVPQSLPAAQSAVLLGPYGNVPRPTSSPFDCASSTKALSAATELSQLIGLAGGGWPVTMLPDRSIMTKS